MTWAVTDLNIATEAKFRALAESGYRVEVLCLEAAQRKGPTYYGLWVMRAVSEDGDEKRLVTARTRTTHNDIKIREFKTATGVVSFLAGLGLSCATIPLHEGKHAWHKLETIDFSAADDPPK